MTQRGGAQPVRAIAAVHVAGDVAGGRDRHGDRHAGDASGLLEGDERLRRGRGRRGGQRDHEREGQERLHAR
jgi:hypothetical protein